MLGGVLELFFRGVSLFCCGCAIIGSAYALVAAACIARFRARMAPFPAAPAVGLGADSSPDGARTAPGVTILKPVYGAEPGLAEALATFCRQDYPGPWHIVLGVASRNDPAVAVVRSLAAAHPERGIELVVDARRHGSNGKVSNLINMSGAIRHEIVVLADSDIVVEPGYLSTVVATLEKPGVGIATCLYYGAADTNVWSRLAAKAVDWHFLPSVLVGVKTGLAHPCMGSTIALRRDVLADVGGFEALADQLADDYALGVLVRRKGLRIAIVPMVVGHLSRERRFIELWKHEIRWARTIRLVDPAGFLGFFVTHALPLALIGALADGLPLWSLAILGLALAARVILATAVRRMLQQPRLDFLLLIPRDILSFAVFVASLFAGRVRWRGLDFTVAGDGTLEPLKDHHDS